MYIVNVCDSHIIGVEPIKSICIGLTIGTSKLYACSSHDVIFPKIIIIIDPSSEVICCQGLISLIQNTAFRNNVGYTIIFELGISIDVISSHVALLVRKGAVQSVLSLVLIIHPSCQSANYLVFYF